MIFILEHKDWHLRWVISLGDKWHEMSNHVIWEKQKKKKHCLIMLCFKGKKAKSKWHLRFIFKILFFSLSNPYASSLHSFSLFDKETFIKWIVNGSLSEITWIICVAPISVKNKKLSLTVCPSDLSNVMVNVLKFCTPNFGQNSIYKQCRPWSDCSWRSSLIRVYTVCHST